MAPGEQLIQQHQRAEAIPRIPAEVRGCDRRLGPLKRLAELEELSRARVADLRAPGQVILKLARRGFGVELAA